MRLFFFFSLIITSLNIHAQYIEYDINWIDGIEYEIEVEIHIHLDVVIHSDVSIETDVGIDIDIEIDIEIDGIEDNVDEIVVENTIPPSLNLAI